MNYLLLLKEDTEYTDHIVIVLIVLPILRAYPTRIVDHDEAAKISGIGARTAEKVGGCSVAICNASSLLIFRHRSMRFLRPETYDVSVTKIPAMSKW